MTDPARIILVDDRETSLQALEGALTPLGQRLVLVRSGEAALKEALRGDVAAILLDMVMPVMDGLEVVRYLRHLEQTRRVPVILISGAGHNIDWAARGYGLGIVDYLVKPVDPWALRAKVRFLVDIHHRQLSWEARDGLMRKRLAAAEQDVHLLRQQLKETKRQLELIAAATGARPERVPGQRMRHARSAG